MCAQRVGCVRGTVVGSVPLHHSQTCEAQLKCATPSHTHHLRGRHGRLRARIKWLNRVHWRHARDKRCTSALEASTAQHGGVSMLAWVVVVVCVCEGTFDS
jgi:hypothetical protein